MMQTVLEVLHVDQPLVPVYFVSMMSIALGLLLLVIQALVSVWHVQPMLTAQLVLVTLEASHVLYVLLMHTVLMVTTVPVVIDVKNA